MYPVLCYVKTTELGPPGSRAEMRTGRQHCLARVPRKTHLLFRALSLKPESKAPVDRQDHIGSKVPYYILSEASPSGLRGGSKPGLEGNLPHGEGASRGPKQQHLPFGQSLPGSANLAT